MLGGQAEIDGTEPVRNRIEVQHRDGCDAQVQLDRQQVADGIGEPVRVVGRQHHDGGERCGPAQRPQDGRQVAAQGLQSRLQCRTPEVRDTLPGDGEDVVGTDRHGDDPAPEREVV
jgi:hypothetical protein